MKPTETYLKCKRQVIDHINTRIDSLQNQKQFVYGTKDEFLLQERIDELENLRHYIRNFMLAETGWDYEL